MTTLSAPAFAGLFSLLPLELLNEKILPRASPLELVRLSGTCKRLRDLSSQDALWETLAARIEEFSFEVWPEKNYKQFYINQIFKLKIKEFKTSLTDEQLKTLSVKFYAATEVNLENCIQISDTGIASLQQLKKIHKIKIDTLQIGGFVHIKNGVALLTKAHPEIEYLHLEYCPNITVKELKKAIKNCKRIISISLRSKDLTNTFIRWITTQHPEVKNLFLRESKPIKDKTVLTLSKCSQLNYLFLKRCEKITPKAFDALPIRSLHVTLQGGNPSLTIWKASHATPVIINILA